MPKVSVIVPNYNHAPFLAARLDSIHAQTFRDFELLFLDDASTDDSLAVFARYQHGGIRTYLNTRNSGSPFRQWNKGVRLARGEFIWFAESDDCCEPDFLETLVARLDAHPEVGLAYSNSRFIDTSGQEVGHVDAWVGALHPTRWLEDHVASGADECRHFLVRRNAILNASAVVFRKELYHRVGGADEGMKLCGDWSTWVKLLLVSDVAYVARRLNHFRVAHPNSVRQRTADDPLCLEEHLEIIGLIQESVELPAEARAQALAGCTEAMHRLRSQGAVADWECLLEAARKVGGDFYHALRDVMAGEAGAAPAGPRLGNRMRTITRRFRARWAWATPASA
jgi:hypothetical protein